MSNNARPLKRVLFVDDSPKFLEKVRKHLPTWSRGKWEILTTLDMPGAFQILETQQVDLVVIDLRLSGIDSIQFLKLAHQQHPHIRKALLSAYPELEVRKEALQSGADLYLTKPKRSSGFESIFHSLDQLFASSVEGFRGLLRTVNLTDLIQLECLNTRSSVLEISAGAGIGKVFIKRGRIVHAQAGSKTGLEAFVRLMRMPGGDFQLKPFVAPGVQTLDMACEHLLLQTAQAVDETSAQHNNTSWFQNISRQTLLPLAAESAAAPPSPRAELVAAVTESGTQSLDDAPNIESGTSPDYHAFSHATPEPDALLSLIDELIANRAQLDMRMLDMALLKEELNGCQARLAATAGQCRTLLPSVVENSAPQCPANQDRAAFSLETAGGIALTTKATSAQCSSSAAELSALAGSLEEISTDTANVVSQLDHFFGSFIEESGQFNATSTHLQNEIGRLGQSSLALSAS